MDSDFKKFIETLENPNTERVANSLQSIGQYDYTDCTEDDLKKIILGMKPNSIRAITTICYVFGLYAKYLENDDLYNMVMNIDRRKLWVMAKPNATQKFISHSGFEEVYHDIGVFEEMNGFYMQTLFRCLYEGIYSDDMSVLKNLRASDVCGDVVTLRDDNGNSYVITVSKQLADDLIELGSMHTWERKNRYGVYKMDIVGLHPDSCFKTEYRNGRIEFSYRFSYYRILRKIAKEYLEYNLLPLQTYISGIMYRICVKLQEHNIQIEDAFANGNKSRLVSQIISDELGRCHCSTPVRNFREMVSGHLDVFCEN